MNEEECAKNMAMALGMASFQAQALECALVSLHAATALDNEKENRATIQLLMDTRYKQTLGRLIKDTFNQLQIPHELQENLEYALQKRNWVTHHFFREYGGSGFNPKLQLKATKILNEIWPFFEKVSDSVLSLVIERMQESGRSEKEINEGIQRALKRYIKEQTIT